MKKILPLILCFLLLAGCAKNAAPEPTSSPEPTAGHQSEAPAPTPFETGFLFTEENYPRVDGSTATIPLIEAVESVLLGKPRDEVSVSVSKTSGAYTALAKGEADVLLVYDGGDETRLEVHADERFETVPIGKDALVFVVNKDNPVDSLTTEQVRKIFSGEYTNWSEVGGGSEPIRAYQRGIGSGSQALMDKLVMKDLPMADPAMVQVVGDMGGLIDAVANYAGGPTGIGYNVYFYVTEMRDNDDIKILEIDGVEPTYDTIQSGEYPFVSEFYSVIRKSEPEDSPARALHKWMLTGEAQNLMVSENYVALSANPDAATPRAGGKFSVYPAGEAPVYFEGVNHYALEPSEAYGELYFYLGGMRQEMFSSPMFYGLCTGDGKIVTKPVYTVATLLTDSKGSKAYLCYRSDLEQESETVDEGDWSYEKTTNPALLFATDGSWVMELEGAMPFYGFAGASDVMMNADILAVKQGGKWGAVNLKGETVIPFERDGYDGIYANPNRNGEYSYLGVTGDRFMRSETDNMYSDTLFSLYDGSGNLLASGLHGMPSSMSGEYIVTSEWSGEGGATVYTYTLDGEFIASLSSENDSFYGAAPLGDYVQIYSEKNTLICDRQLNILYELPNKYDEQTGYYSANMGGPNVLYQSDRQSLFHRTYLPDGTRLVTWYDPEMNDSEYISQY